MSPRRLKIAACILLALVTLTVYAGVRNHQFIDLDDDLYVSRNAQVYGGFTLKGLAWAFTTWHVGFWMPVAWLSFMLDCQLFGLHAGGHHLTNLFFHVANTLLLFLWLLRLTRALGPSFLVAALFALHPLHVESVAWVVERKDVLSTFFWLLAMWAYAWYAERPGLGRYLLIPVCFSLGLMVKPMLVTLPFVLLLLDYWPLGRLSLNGPAAAKASPPPGPGVPLTRLVGEKAPLLVLSALSSVVTFYASEAVGAVVKMERLPLTSRLANALVVYVRYLGKMLWPTDLAVLYPWHDLPPWQPLAAGLVLAALSLLVIRQARRYPYLLVGWLWYLGTLVPVIGLVQAGQQAMADRFTYVPFIGVFIMVAWGMADLAARWRALRFLLPLSAGVALSALTVCTWVQVRYWRDSFTLFEHTLRVTGNNPVIQNNLGFALFSQGRLSEAIPHYREALRLRPKYVEAHNNLGAALANQGKTDEAVPHYEEALRLKPDYVEAHYNLGNALAKQGKVEQALVHYAEALRLRPEYADAHNNLGIALDRQGKADQAMAHFAEALRLRPNFAEAQYNLGNSFYFKGQMDQAVVHYAEALRLRPEYAEAHNNLANAFFSQGKVEQAVAHYAEALRAKPDYVEAQNNLGLALASQGKVDQAVVQYAEALRLRPGYAEAHNNLGLALGRQGKVDEAMAHYAEALRFKPNFAEAHGNLGDALVLKGKVDQARAHYQEAIRLQPENPQALDRLAVILATANDKKLRQGPAAVAMAEKANQLTGHSRPEMLDTLAAAYAEAGRFSEAIETSRKALELAAAAGQPELALDIGARLRLYQAGQPYHAGSSMRNRPGNPGW